MPAGQNRITKEFILERFDYREGVLYNNHTYERRPFKLRGKLAGCARKDGYVVIRLDNQLYLLHRVIWFLEKGEWPRADMDLDHIDKNPSNNRIENLREVTRAVNIANGNWTKNKTGFRGVFLTPAGRYAAHAKNQHLGVFNTPEEAHERFMSFMRKVYDLPS